MTLHRGKIARNPTITNVRALTRDDLMVLNEGRKATKDSVGTGIVDRLRDPHHRLARMIAAGLKGTEAAERAGYSYNRALTLQKDPAFKELVAKYRGMVDSAFVREADNLMELATSNMMKAERQIAEKLEIADEDGIPLPTRDLIAISADRMDRFGYGKRQTNLNVNADFASLLEKARQRSGKTIEGHVTSPPFVGPQSPGGERTPAQSSPEPLRQLTLRRI